MPAQIMDENSSFLSKAFLIRYCEEEVEVNDIVQFRAELEVEPDYLNTEFFLEIDLFFSDLASLGGPEKWQANYTKYEEEAQFKLVNTQRFRIQRLAHGLTEFLPVVFEDQYFSQLNLQVCSLLLDFRFRTKSLSEVQKELQGMCTTEVTSSRFKAVKEVDE